MKNKDYIGKDYPKVCAVCEWGRPSADGTAILCSHRGIVDTESHCRKFVYDPLKRDPRPAAPAILTDEYKPEDFEL